MWMRPTRPSLNSVNETVAPSAPGRREGANEEFVAKEVSDSSGVETTRAATDFLITHELFGISAPRLQRLFIETSGPGLLTRRYFDSICHRLLPTSPTSECTDSV